LQEFDKAGWLKNTKKPKALWQRETTGSESRQTEATLQEEWKGKRQTQRLNHEKATGT